MKALSLIKKFISRKDGATAIEYGFIPAKKVGFLLRSPYGLLLWPIFAIAIPIMTPFLTRAMSRTPRGISHASRSMPSSSAGVVRVKWMARTTRPFFKMQHSKVTG